MSFIPSDLEPLLTARDRIGLESLGTALASESYQGRTIEAHYITEEGGIGEIRSEYWCSKFARETMFDGKYRSDLGPPWDGAPVYIFIDEDDTDPASEIESPAKSKIGRPPLDWDAVFIAVACHIAIEGLPKTQSEFISRVQQKLGSKAPGDTQMKERIGPLYNAVKKALG